MAAAGEAQLGVIRGRAGIGKTRLIEELGLRARERGGRMAIGRAWLDGDAPPLWPWRAVLRDLDAPAGILDDRPSSDPGRFARFLAVLEHIGHAARLAPVIVVIDDAHLADEATLLLVRFLASERALPLLLLLACREDAIAAAAPARGILAGIAQDGFVIELGGLPDEAVDAYLTSLGGGALDPDTRQAVRSVTQGNPLHLRSLVVEAGHGGDLQGGLERAIRGLLEELSDADRRLIAIAALLGPDVSVYDAARAADATVAEVSGSLARAERLGLLASTSADRFVFVHEIVRREAGASASAADCLDAHARIAALLAGHGPDRVVRRAHHALAAAIRSRTDAARAVETARDASRVLMAADGFESAAALLGRAAEIQRAALPEAPAGPVLVEHAEAVLACGRLAESRPLFLRTARVADREGDPVVLGRAALGLGGVWVSEHRLATEAEAMLALQQRALESLPAGESVLRARLAVRLAAEHSYRGGAIRAVLDAVDGVRRTGDRHALAEALSLAHHALLTPAHGIRRLAMSEELIRCAAAAGDSFLTLVGLCWRTVDLFHLGDRGANRALAELRVRADALGCRSVAFIALAMETMRSIRAGRFEAAEASAAACFALGTEAGDADALAYHGAHLSAIRYFQGREAELADLTASIATSPTLIEDRDRAFLSAAALFALRAGRPQLARQRLDWLAREGLGSIPESSSWLVTLTGVVEMAAELADRRIAQAAYEALLPHASLPAMASLAVVCFGSVQRALGVAAQTCDNPDLAIEHFSAAIAANQGLGHRPAAIQAQAELGLAWLRRASATGDRAGTTLLEDAIAEGEAIGMTGLAARWRTAADRLGRAPARGRAAGGVSMTAIQGGRWRLALDTEVATMPDRVGLRYLRSLLAAPDQGIPALALVLEGGTPAGVEDGEPERVLDRKAVQALRGRIDELRGRDATSDEEDEELAVLIEALSRAMGLGGRLRTFADAPERARTAVRKALKRAIDEIAVANASIGRHLAGRIETGAVCCYHLQSPQQADGGSGQSGNT